MNKPKAFFVVSAYNNDVSWVKDYTDNYIIYDKSHSLDNKEYNIIRVENVGYNIFDICHFIINNYENLPELTAFLEGWPFDHCKRETFDKLIYNETFTPIEDYSHIPESGYHKKGEDGGYTEINNSWYVLSHKQTHGSETGRYFNSYNQFLDTMFQYPKYPAWIRFSPGGQYIVPKENILFYSLSFYQRLLGSLSHHRIPVEGHIIERALYYIFTNKWKERK